jgi:hypothetical protein
MHNCDKCGDELTKEESKQLDEFIAENGKPHTVLCEACLYMANHPEPEEPYSDADPGL